MRRTALRLLAGAAALSIAIGGAAVRPAFGWESEVLQDTRVVRIHREADDGTRTITLEIWGKASLPNGAAYADGSYDSTASMAKDTTLKMDADGYVAEVPVTASYLNIVVVEVGSERRHAFALPASYLRAHPVYLTSYQSESAAGTLAVSVTNTVAVSQTASVALAGTVTADVASLPGLTTESFAAPFYAGLIALGIGIAYIADRSWKECRS